MKKILVTILITFLLLLSIVQADEQNTASNTENTQVALTDTTTNIQPRIVVDTTTANTTLNAVEKENTELKPMLTSEPVTTNIQNPTVTSDPTIATAEGIVKEANDECIKLVMEYKKEITSLTNSLSTLDSINNSDKIKEIKTEILIKTKELESKKEQCVLRTTMVKEDAIAVSCDDVKIYKQKLDTLNKMLANPDSAIVNGVPKAAEDIKAEIQKIMVDKGEAIKRCSTQTITQNAVIKECIQNNWEQGLNELLIELNTQVAQNNMEEVKRIKAKIEANNQEIRAQKEKCMSLSQTTTTTASSTTAIATNPMVSVQSCADLMRFKEKLAYYEKAYLDKEKLTSLGLTENQVLQIKQQLRQSIEQVMKNCNEDKRENLGEMISLAVKNKEGGANDIAAYYKAKMSEVVSSEDTTKQIESLKTLRTEIDNMIRELMKNQKNLKAEEVAPLVNEIKVSKREISADGIKVESTDSTLTVNVNDVATEISPTESGAMIESEGVNATAIELSYENGSIKVGNKIVKFSPKQISNKLNLKEKIQKMELKDDSERNKAIYNVVASEKRKLFWVIPINVEKTYTIDGSNGELIKEDRPWWAIASSKAKDTSVSKDTTAEDTTSADTTEATQ
ncbi:MAG: hypothetical protein WC755_06425 [Candidatus Woesearchaeota archaeon]|jgi:hypothetical protein